MIKNKLIKIFEIISVLLICLILLGFNNEDENIKYVRCNYVEGMNGLTFIIDSKEELDNYFDTYKDEYGLSHNENSDSERFEDVIEEYDEEFFVENQLVIILLSAEGSNIRFKVKDYEVVDGVMNVSIEEVYPLFVQEQMSGMYVLKNISKIQNINKVIL